jgi:4-amino-4-deoxy-L-arabinose transferase-like glycosyltransferase
VSAFSTAAVHDARSKKFDAAIAAALALFTVVGLALTEQDIGFTRDEGYYFKAAKLYFGWFQDLFAHVTRGDITGAFSQAVIDKHWSYNHEHPVLVKTLFALSWGVLKEQFGLFALSSSALRFPAWLFAGLSVALVYLFARTLKLTILSSTFAALLWITMPRVFWHAHLSCFDIPVCAAHLWLVLAYYKGRASVKGAVIVGIAFGFAAAVKHNVLVAPAIFVLHWLLTDARGFRREHGGFRLPPIPLAFFSMATLGPVVFIAHWPYLWPDVIMRIGWYLGFHLTHEHYPILYFGDLLTHPPFPVAFPFVMSAVTIPTATLVAMSVGFLLAVVVVIRGFVVSRTGGEPEVTSVPLGDVAREPSASPALLLLLNIAYPFALIALPSSPIFGGTKHWMNALPFLCILAAWALDEARARMRHAWPTLTDMRRVALFACLAFIVVLPSAILTARVHPYGLSAYNSVTGFARGAANVGFQRTFWGYEAREALPLINARAKSNGRIHFGDTNRDDHAMYRSDGLLRSDLAYSGSVRGSDVASVQPQGEFKEQWIEVLNEWRPGGPDAVVHVEGVPLLTVTFRE